MRQSELNDCLRYIRPSELSYQEWVNVGMALKEAGHDVSEWEAWSQRDPDRYHEGECRRKWESFDGAATPVTAGTIVHMAQERGWSRPDGELAWDAEIYCCGDDMGIVDTAYLELDELQAPPDAGWDPVDELRQYLQALFRSDEYVGYLVDSWEKDGKWIPASGGNYKRTAGQLIDGLNRCKGDIGAVLGDSKPEAGAWIRFNPLDGKGVKNDNVTDLRYTLVESDEVAPEMQLAIIRELELPCAAIVHSGNKSIHAIVHIDAGTDKAEYRKRVEQLYSILRKNGLPCDEQNKNPSRLSRMPGIRRGAKQQYLISTNTGKKNWAEWVDWYADEADELPDFCKVPEERLSERPTLIAGILREGDKLMLSGPSKAGKSFALIELSIAISRGMPWLGWQCTAGKVLYVNMELQPDSCLSRFQELGRGNQDNLDIWNLRGEDISLKELLPKLIRRTKGRGYKAIVLDPIYKIMGGDENNAEQVSRFCTRLDTICKQTGAAVIYCHHHSKGAQGGKSAIDRASGSGVFARDADALLDMIQLRLGPSEETSMGHQFGATAWRMEAVLRDFPNQPPKDLWFEYPRHMVDCSGELMHFKPDTGQQWTTQEMNQAKSAKKEKTRETAITVFDQFLEKGGTTGDGGVALEEIVKAVGGTPESVAKLFSESEFTFSPKPKNRYDTDGKRIPSNCIIRRRMCVG